MLERIKFAQIIKIRAILIKAQILENLKTTIYIFIVLNSKFNFNYFVFLEITIYFINIDFVIEKYNIEY